MKGSPKSRMSPKNRQNFYNGIGKRHEHPLSEIWLGSASILPQKGFMPVSFSPIVQSRAKYRRFPFSLLHLPEISLKSSSTTPETEKTLSK
jgi:hypothetical protein